MEYYARQIMVATQEAGGPGGDLSALVGPLTDIRDELLTRSPSGEGIQTLMELLYNTQTIITLGFTEIRDNLELNTNQHLIEIFERVGLLSAQYEETAISLASGSASAAQQFNGFANCNCSFTLAGLLANETAVLAIEQKATPNAPYAQMQLATVTGLGPHTITFSDFPALELRLRLVSAVNPATRLTGVYWRFGK